MKPTDISSDQLLPSPANHTPLLTLVWYKDQSRDLDARRTVKNMMRHSCGPYGSTAIVSGDAALAWGILLPEKFPALTSWSIYVNGNELCLFEGDMYDDLPGLKLQPGNNAEIARRVASHMQKDPDKRISDLNGIYGAVYINHDQSCAYLFGDPTGTRPIFWLSDQKRFIVTGNLWAFRGCEGLERRWDNMALMEILTIGFPMAGRTWMSAVKQLQPGKQVRSYRDGRTEYRPLLEPISRKSWSIQHSVRVLRETLDEVIDGIYRRLNAPLGLALSGGIDSRNLLASLYTQGIKHRSFTFFVGRDDEADSYIAPCLAKMLGSEHRNILLDPARAARMHRDFRLINEGDSPGFGYCILAAQAKGDIDALLIGYESMRIDPPGAFDPFSVKTKHALAKSMLRGYMTQFTGDQASRLIAPPNRVSWQDVLDEWFNSFEQINEDSIIDVCLNHMTNYKHQRVIRARIDAARWFCLPIYPYLDNRLYTAYYSLPLAHLKGDRAHLALLSDYKLGLENVRAAARHFSLPMHKEYRYRDFIHLGRVVQERYLTPFRNKWQETKGAFGFGANMLYSHWEPELRKLRDRELFNWTEVENYIEKARRGSFVNRNAIDCLIKALVIDDFLFKPGSSTDASLRYLKPARDIQIIHPTTEVPIASNGQANADRAKRIVQPTVSTNSHRQEALSLPAINQTPLFALAWLKRSHRAEDARKIVKNMLRHSCGPYGLTAVTGGDSQLAWGMLLPERFGPLTCWSVYFRGSELCLIEGDMYDDLPSLKLLPGDNPELARQVAAHIRHHPDQRLKDLIGIYSGVYVNPERSCAYAFGDLTGNRTVLWLSDQTRFVVCGNLWAFRGCDGLDRRWDKMALTEMLTLGIPLAGRTWIDGVKQLQRGRQVYSFADGRTEVRTLLEPVCRKSWSLRQSISALRDNMDETITRLCRRVAAPVGLALSGGLDSRTLLASLHTQRLEHRNFTFLAATDQTVDDQIAKAASKLLGEKHRTVVLDSKLVGPIHREFRLINEGDSPGFGYFLLAAHVQKYSNALMIGHEAVRETAGSFNPLSVKSKRELANRMLRSYMTFFLPKQTHALLDAAYRVAWNDVLEEWFDSFEQINQPTIMDVYLDHVANHRVQRRTRHRIDACRWFCVPVYPYMDDRLYTTYYSLPLEHLHGEQAPIALLTDYGTGLEKLRAAASHFGMPIYKEYRYEAVIRMARIAKENLILPINGTWQKGKAAAGFGRSILYSHWEPDIRSLKSCQLFDRLQVRETIDDARRGLFNNGSAIDRLIDALTIHDFLFNDGLSGERALRFLEPVRNVNFVHSAP